MYGYIKSISRVLTTVALTFAVIYTHAQTNPQEIKTDAIAHKAIRLFNAHQADSIYALTGQVFRQQITQSQWKQIVEKQLITLLPLKNCTFISSYNNVSNYKVDGTIMLTFNISLDSFGKIENLSFVPYREEAKSAPMTDVEKKTDEVAMKVLDYLNTKQADQMYRFAAQSFKSDLDSATWHNVIEKQLYPMLPIPKPVFLYSRNGVNKYRMGQLQYLVGIDKTDKFSTWAIQPYYEDAKKIEKVASDNPLRSKLDSIVNKWLTGYIQTKGNIGLSAAVYYKGADHYYNYGETVKGNHKLPDVHTLYEIGSITKTFTATLLAKATIDGLVKLDDPVTKYLPDSVAANAGLKDLTLTQLSNHTSGLPRMPDNIDATVTDLNQPYEHYDEKHLFAFLKNFKAIRAPGSSYEYSNLAVGLLGVILEKVYHKPYEELVKLYITQPLQLPETKVRLTEEDVKHLAQGYDGAINPVAPWRQQATKAAGAIKSSAVDMLRYGKLQLPQFSNPLSKELKLIHQSTFQDAAYTIGLGWHYIQNEHDAVLQHTGGTGGYRTALCVNLNRSLVVVVLTNNASTGDGLGIELTTALMKTLPR
ncbi:MAG: serine hydrolase domain-containing protein [Mucilaginibacter sp.]|uniref:serine hydrolase domain-containing protein n=1 Tax=Mucilaginibacter sp. TaxID=1882438 RepID=UPI0032674C81